METHKICNACLETKVAEEFYKRGKGRKDRSACCRTCVLKQQKIREAKNPEKSKKSNRERAAKYRNSHKEKVKEAAIKYRTSVKGKYSNYLSAYNRKVKTGAPLASHEFSALMNKPCAYCEEKLSPSGHSIDRLDSNKGYEKDNLIQCCGKCNRIKNNLSIKELKNHLPKMIKGLSKL